MTDRKPPSRSQIKARRRWFTRGVVVTKVIIDFKQRNYEAAQRWADEDDMGLSTVANRAMQIYDAVRSGELRLAKVDEDGSPQWVYMGDVMGPPPEPPSLFEQVRAWWRDGRGN